MNTTKEQYEERDKCENCGEIKNYVIHRVIARGTRLCALCYSKKI